MALTDENIGTTMLVQPSGNNSGCFGDNGWWIILLLLCCGGGFGGFGGWNGMGFGGMYEFPWLLNGQNGINANTNAGFAQAQTSAALGDISNGMTAGFGNIQTSLCNGFAGVNATVNGAQTALAQQMYTNQLADLERSFNAQAANTAGLTNISAQLSQGFCDNRASAADLKYTLATEACNSRATSTANTQAILDKLCQLELDNVKAQIDAKNDTIAQLRQEVLYARGQASQDVQTARILAGQTAEVDALYNRLNNCPVSTVPVYGRQPIFTCNNSAGCGM